MIPKLGIIHRNLSATSKPRTEVDTEWSEGVASSAILSAWIVSVRFQCGYKMQEKALAAGLGALFDCVAHVAGFLAGSPAWSV